MIWASWSLKLPLTWPFVEHRIQVNNKKGIIVYVNCSLIVYKWIFLNQANNKENTRDAHSGPFVTGIRNQESFIRGNLQYMQYTKGYIRETIVWWMDSFTRGQGCGKHFHVMMSSCYIQWEFSQVSNVFIPNDTLGSMTPAAFVSETDGFRCHTRPKSVVGLRPCIETDHGFISGSEGNRSIFNHSNWPQGPGLLEFRS